MIVGKYSEDHGDENLSVQVKGSLHQGGPGELLPGGDPLVGRIVSLERSVGGGINFVLDIAAEKPAPEPTLDEQLAAEPDEPAAA